MRTHHPRYIICSPSQQYYVCAFNGFDGCCSINPCSLPAGCPDTETIGIGNGPLTSTKAGQATIVQPVESSATLGNSISSSLETSAQILLSTASGIITTISSTTTATSLVSHNSNVVAGPRSNSNTHDRPAGSASGTSPASSSVGPTPTTLAAATGVQRSPTSRGVVAGSVIGAAAFGLALLSLLLFCRRRVKQRKKVVEEVQVQQTKGRMWTKGRTTRTRGFSKLERGESNLNPNDRR